MNDYNELIENVRICASGDCCGCTLHGNKINCQEVLLESAADAIEQLAKEVSFLTKECNRLSAQCGRSATKNTNLQIEYDILAKMYETVSKERDAAVADLAEQIVCHVCKHSKTHIDDEPCNSCGNQTRFEWRGVQEDNNEVD